MIDRAQVEACLQELSEVERRLADPSVSGDRKLYREVLREHTRLKRIEAAATEWQRLLGVIADAEVMAGDPELGEMAAEEAKEADGMLPEAEAKLLRALLPADPLDGHDALVEIRAGTGGG